MKIMCRGAMGLYLLIVVTLLPTLQLIDSQELNNAPQLLTQYDGTSSSSSFGEPIFRLEPPTVINFANTQGTTILCLASGSPRPTVNWYSSLDLTQITLNGQMMFGGEMSLQQSRPVNNVTNLRLIMNNGALLRLLPFKEGDFRQDIHSTEYRCVASNKLATIHSRSVLVQAVMSNGSGTSGSENSGPNSAAAGAKRAAEDQQQQTEVKVSDEFVTLNSVAVFKCRAAGGVGGLPEFSHLVEWFTSDGLQIRASDTSKGNKLVAFKSGELHVNNVDMLDLQRTYGCRMRNSITNRIVSSSGLAQLIVTDSLESTRRSSGSNMVDERDAALLRFGPQVLHTVNQLIMIDTIHWSAELGSPRLLLPCAVRGPPARELKWLFKPNSRGLYNQKPVALEQWAASESMAVQYLAPDAPPADRRLTAAGHLSNSSSGGRQLQQQRTSFIVGPTFMAIDRPTRGQSGRYTCHWTAHGLQSEKSEILCDINVIIRVPMKLAVQATVGGGGGENQAGKYYASAQLGSVEEETSSQRRDESGSWLQRLGLAGWFDWTRRSQVGDRVDALDQEVKRDKRAPGEEDESSPQSGQPPPPPPLPSSNPLIENDASRVQVHGRGVIEAPPIVSVGQRLQLDCLGSGHPIEGVKWFRNGLAINTQSSNDFQVEITNTLIEQQQQPTDDQQQLQQQPQIADRQLNDKTPEPRLLLSSLIIRQVQPKEIGLNVFECFAHNSLGDRARAGRVVFVAERALVDWARATCPLAGNDTAWPADASDTGNLDYMPAGEANGDELAPDDGAAEAGGSKPSLVFRRNNPLRRSLILESEPVELRCPVQQQQPQGAQMLQTRPHHHQKQQHRANSSPRLEWRRLVAPVASGAADAATNKQQTTSGAANSELQASSMSLNQLFGGDSRFVINGSSLQMRSPSKRYDEAVYVCRQSWQASEPLAGRESGQQAAADPMAYNHRQATTGHASNLQRPQQAAPSQVHQSSLAPPSTSQASRASACDSLLEWSLFRAEQPAANHHHQQQQQQRAVAGSSYMLPSPVMSSISIRIVAKPKIDPFEFSRNLEEGMRAVVICAVISGQSPVDITWFKDGQYLLADEQITIDQSNGFSSTLTFQRILPAHMGLYTCVAANAFASTNHTSRLIVNVSPYFINAPKNTRAILGSNVLINCQAGGQPSPQIRWRKLIPIGSASLGSSSIGKQVAPAIGNQARQLQLDLYANNAYNDLDQIQAPISQGSNLQQSVNLNDFFGPQFQSSISNSNQKFEFRIVTSNSHIQILENGSMIIKEVELGDSSYYVCQAFNGINPSLSEVIDLTVLSPAQFVVHYETVSAKRDSMIKFNCAPKGDQPMQIEWYKEGNRLVSPTSSAGNGSQQQQLTMLPNKYNEIAHLFGAGERQRHTSLVIQQQQQQQMAQPPASSNQTTGVGPRFPAAVDEGVVMSELLISYADRGDTGAFVCVARNAYGKDELTYRLIVQELPDVPTLVQAQSVQANNLKLVWGSPFDGNLPLSHFVIEYRRLMAGQPQNGNLQAQIISQPGSQETRHNEWTRLVVSSGQLATNGDQSMNQVSQNQQGQTLSSTKNQQQGSQYSLALRQLNPKTTYHIRVAAVNAIGQSAFSTPIVVTTAEEPPSSRPDDLRAQPVSSSSIRVLWRGPALVDEQAPVKGYYVSHRKLSPKQDVGVVKPDESKPVAGQQLWIATSSLSANLNNSKGYREQEMEQSNLQVGGGGQIKQFGPNSNGGPNYEFILNALDKDTKYEIRVQPYNTMGVGPASDTIGQTLKFDRPGQPNLKLISSRRQSFELKWTISDDQPIMGFSLFYKCEYDDWQEIQLGLIYHYIIENLRCGNKYQIYLSAFNVVGRSDPSDVLSVRTEGTVPIAPNKGQFVRSNITEAILDMSGWQSGGCPISSFMIQFKRMHDSNWFILSEGATPFAMSDKITIPDLSPATWYKLLVTALNEAGSTNAEYLFSTLTTHGKQIAPNFPLDGIHQETNTGGWLSNNEGGRSMLSGLNQLLFTSSGSGNNQDQAQLLLPMSCILLLLVTMLASYLYYSRSGVGRGGGGGGESPASEQRKLTSSKQTQLMDRIHMHGCRSETNTLSRDEKHNIQSDHLHHNQLMGANTLPLDGSQRMTADGLDGQIHVRQQQTPSGALTTESMLETLVNNTNFQSLMDSNLQSDPKANQRVHGMRLLSSGNIFSPTMQQLSNGNIITGGSNCTNSLSLSTQSTNCNFDCGASSQASSSGLSSGGCGVRAKAKLQLIDESSLISAAPSGNINEPTMEHQQQHFIYGGQQQQVGPCSNMSPSHQQVYAQSATNHVDLIIDPNEPNNSPETNQMIEANLGNLFTGSDYHGNSNNNNNRFYGQRLVTTSSFASAADLLQRQQKIYQKQHSNEEPIYQRLDNFQTQHGLPLSKHQLQQQQLPFNQIKSNTLHFNSHMSTGDPSVRSMTLHRAQPSLCLGGDGQYPNGFYLPPNLDNSHDSCTGQNQI